VLELTAAEIEANRTVLALQAEAEVLRTQAEGMRQELEQARAELETLRDEAHNLRGKLATSQSSAAPPEEPSVSPSDTHSREEILEMVRAAALERVRMEVETEIRAALSEGHEPS
jgi:HPt (histidine-containing phosphotransfer) domain-containing protein